MESYKKSSLLILVIFLILQSFISCQNISNTNNFNNMMNIHYIDVGQGDSILIQVNNKNLLIDSGPKESEDKLFKYLKDLNIKTLDYIIATHPHEDHIGGLIKIINNFNINKFYAPKVTNNTQIFQDMIYNLKNKKLKINIIKAGMGADINLGKNTMVEIFSPNEEAYTDLNDYSPIMKITYGNNSFLFTGDAEKIAEDEVLSNKNNLESDVIKIGHHGSSSSTSTNFIKAVNPKIAVISLSKENKYGHPHEKTLKTLENFNIEIYRTDEDGTIILSSNGSTVKKLK